MWHVESAFREGIGEHHARAAGMGDDGEILSLEGRQGEDAAHGGEFFARVAAHDACLAEEGLDGRVAGGDRARMTGGSTASALGGTCLDGGDATALADETAGVEEQFVRVTDVLDIEQFDLGVGLGVEVLVHILQHILDADLFAVADAPHAVEPQALDDRTLEDEDRCGP